MADDDLLGQFLKETAPPPATVAAPGAAAAPSDDLLSAFLPAQGAPVESVADALGHGRMPVTPGAVPPSYYGETFDRTAPLSQQVEFMGRHALDYAADQAKGVPGQIAADFRSGEALTGSGVKDLKSGNILPAFPSSDPSTWSAGGALKTAAGIAGALTSPISGPTEKIVTEPVTEGTGNPQAGQIAGMAAAGLATNALPAIMRSAPADAETLRLANVAKDNNIPIRASQISTSPFIQKVDQVTGWIPGSGRAGENAAQQSAFTRAVSHSFGEDTDQITRQTIQDAKTRIGGVLNDVEGRTPIQFDAPTVQSLAKAQADARNMFGAGTDRYNIVQDKINQIVQLAQEHNGVIPGDAWAGLYHKGSPIDRLSGAQDSDVARIAGDLKSAAQDAVQRQAAPDDAQAYTNARFQYKNMKTVEPLVTTGAPGEISPAGLNQKVRTGFDTTNAGPLGDLADLGQRFLRQPKDSGTPLGEKVLRMMTAPGEVLGSALAGHSLGFSIPEIAGMGVAAPAVSAGVSRIASALLNNPIYRNSLLRGGASDTRNIAKELIYGSLPNMPTNGPSNPR